MSRYAYEPHEHEHATFRHAMDKNALTIWVVGMAVLAFMMALPALV